MPEVQDKNVLYRGSVKDVCGAVGDKSLLFHFSDRYSVFDWGEMPDLLPGKGAALAAIGDLFFRFLGNASVWRNWKIPSDISSWLQERLQKGKVLQSLKDHGVLHHSEGLVEPGVLKVRGFQRLLPAFAQGKYDYSVYKVRPVDTLVPLEVVFRFGAPEGSSFLARAKERPGYSKGLGLGDVVAPGALFPHPVVEFFTKLESTDRFLYRDDAKALAFLTDEEMAELEQLTILIALRMRDLFAQIGVELWDGKFEFAFVAKEEKRRGFCLGDSIGPDELRLIKNGVHLSKEALRLEYRESSWYKALEKAKAIAAQRGEKDFHKICRDEFHEEPKALPKAKLSAAAALYPALVNSLAVAIGEKSSLSTSMNLDDVVRALGGKQ